MTKSNKQKAIEDILRSDTPFSFYSDKSCKDMFVRATEKLLALHKK